MLRQYLLILPFLLIQPRVLLLIMLPLIMLLLPPASARPTPVRQAKPAASELVSLTLDDVPLRQALQTLAETGHVNLVIAPDVQGNVSLHLVNVTWQQALQALTSSGQLYWQRQDKMIYIHSHQWLNQQQEQQQQAQQQRLLNQPLHTKSIALHYASADQLAQTINGLGDKLLTSRGSVSGDKRTNRLLLRDTRQALQQIEQWISHMDIPSGQVELAAYIVTINQTSLQELGIKWGATDTAEQTTQGQGLTQIVSDLSINDPNIKVGFNIARLNGRMLAVELSALEQKNQLEIIANPRLIASHQQPASIKQGSEIPYQVSSGESGATSIEFKEAVLGMEVTPAILADNHIHLKLRISQNTPGRILKQSAGEVLAIDKQEIETQLEVKNGETIALGGIFQHKQQQGNEKTPILGDIPLFGKLFRHDGNDQQRRELVVFITPRILKQ